MRGHGATSSTGTRTTGAVATVRARLRAAPTGHPSAALPPWPWRRSCSPGAVSASEPCCPRPRPRHDALTLDVTSARTEPRALGGAGVTEGDAVDSYKFIINEDNTGTTAQRTAAGACSRQRRPGYPPSCHWPSIREAPARQPRSTPRATRTTWPRPRPARRPTT